VQNDVNVEMKIESRRPIGRFAAAVMSKHFVRSGQRLLLHACAVGWAKKVTPFPTTDRLRQYNANKRQNVIRTFIAFERF